MNFQTAVKTCLRKYATFKGRASRSELWFWILFNWVLVMICYQIDVMMAGGLNYLAASGMPVTNIINLLLLLPTMAVCVRRLHDVGRSGWWFLLTFTVIGFVLLLYWYVRPSRNPESSLASRF